MVMHQNDNAALLLFNNRMLNMQRPAMKEGLNARRRSAADSKVKTISVRFFSKATIDGNVIQGYYDYTINIDGQKNAIAQNCSRT
jgi:hypothetical protein